MKPCQHGPGDFCPYCAERFEESLRQARYVDAMVKREQIRRIQGHDDAPQYSTTGRTIKPGE